MDYPQLWRRGLIQRRIREKANHCCEECGMKFRHGTNLAVSEKNRNGRPVIGTVHHIDHNKRNCAASNLVYLCQRCHYRIHLYDWKPGKPLPPQWHGSIPAWVKERHPEIQPLYIAKLI